MEHVTWKDGERRNTHGLAYGKLGERKPLEHLGVEGRIILK
jgi:hypothetical protein